MAGLDMLLQGGRTAISPEFLRLLGVGLQDAAAPTLAEMMPGSAVAAGGGGAALPLAGGAAALAALGAGGAAVNDMVVGRQRDPGGLLESLRAAAERDPRALPLYERELRRMGGTPPASAAPPARNYAEDMRPALQAAAQGLTKKSPASLPASRGPAGNRVGVAPDADFEKSVAAQEALAKRIAEAKAKAAGESPVTDNAKQRRDFDLTNGLNVPDPMNSRAISDAMIAFGGKLLASEGRDVGGGVQEGGKAWMAGRDRNEKQAQDAQDRRLKNFMDSMGLGQKDAESLSAKNKAILDAAIAGIDAEGVGIKTRQEFAKEGRKEALEREKLRSHEKVAGIMHAQKDPLASYDAVTKRIGAIDEAVRAQGGKPTPQQEEQRGILLAQIKGPKEERIKPADAAKVRAEAQMMWPGNPAMGELEYQYRTGSLTPEQQDMYFRAAASKKK